MTESAPSPSEDAARREAELLRGTFDRRRRTLRVYLGLLALPLAAVGGLVAFGQSDLGRVRSVATAAIAPAESAYRAIQPRLVAVGRLDTVLPRLDSALPRLDAVFPRLDTVASDARATARLLARQDSMVQRFRADLTDQSQQLTRVQAMVQELPRIDVAALATVEQLRGLRDQVSRVEAQQASVVSTMNRLNAALETIQGLQGSVRRLDARIDSLRVNRRPDVNRIP